VLAAAGLGSRRQCEELISAGRVEVDRRVVTALGTRVDPVQQEIRVDGEPLPRPKRQYLMLNKPTGVISTARDPAGRTRVTDLVGSHQRLFPIGRLDLSSEGLILLTNDGELANLVAHPRYEIEKTYLAQVAGAPSREALARLERGVHLAEGFAHAKRVRIKSQHKQSTTLEIILDEGRNREVRRLLARVGHKVLRLKRIAIGPLRLGNLSAGEYRPLTADEVRELKETALAALERPRRPKREPDKVSLSAPAERTESTQKGPADLIAESLVEDFNDSETPLHPGTIIGDDKVSQTAERRTVPSVKPLIDVRRGIFPGRLNDDFDEDEDDELTPQRAVAPPLPAKGRRQRKKTRPAGEGRPPRNGRPQKKNRPQRKTPRRDSSAGPSASRRAPKGANRPKGRRR
jgi:23S rRNA pseudouridine2605 synthase